MAMGLRSGVRAGLPKVLKGSPRLHMPRATATNNQRGNLKLTELEFFTSQVWRIPSGVRSLARLVGLGGAGSPASSSVIYEKYRSVTVTYDSPEYGQSGTETTLVGYESYNPGDYCDPAVYYPAEHATLQYCYAYQAIYYSYEPTYGPNATGFDRTFFGGYAGPATPVEYLGTPVSAGTEVSLIIPVGGYIKIAFLAR